jgi:hypothetical protein
MEFEDAASYFDQTPVTDGYTGVALFLGRTSPHDDHSSAGATSRRRTLTTAPGNVAPARGVVSVQGDRWLIGSSNLDNYLGDPIRINYDLKKVTDAATRYTPAEACLAQGGTRIFLRREWYRDQSDTSTSADYYTMWNVFVPQADSPTRGAILALDDGTLLRARNTYLAQERLVIVEADELDADARQPAQCITTGKLSIAEDRQEEDIRNTVIISLDVSKFYRYATKKDADYQPGDRIFLVPRVDVPSPKIGMRIQTDKVWQVKQITPEADVWACRVRLA